jgi:hypothetical protein
MESRQRADTILPPLRAARNRHQPSALTMAPFNDLIAAGMTARKNAQQRTRKSRQ